MQNSIAQTSFDFDSLIDYPYEPPKLRLAQPPSRKRCTMCRKWKSFNDFYETITPAGKKVKVAKCKICCVEYGKQYDRREPDKRRQRTRRDKLKGKYNLGVEEYDAMLEAQGGVCAVCGKHETSIDHKTKQVRRLAVDHDHDTGKVRGLLCRRCNLDLGRYELNLKGKFAKYHTYLEHYR